MHIFFQHGRVKVRTTAEQEEILRKEKAAKVVKYKANIAIIFQKVKHYFSLLHIQHDNV